MYADLGNHYRAAVLEMAQADRKAAEGWRFRSHKGAASRALSAAWAGLKGLVGKAVRIAGPDIAPARQRLSYQGPLRALKGSLVSALSDSRLLVLRP